MYYNEGKLKQEKGKFDYALKLLHYKISYSSGLL